MAALDPTIRATIVARVKLLVDRNDADTLIGQLVDDAAEQALNYTHRTVVTGEMLKPIGDLAVVAYNRLGTEGESGRSEGGESYSFIEEPNHIYKILRGMRLARVCGNAYEAEPDNNEISEG